MTEKEYTDFYNALNAAHENRSITVAAYQRIARAFDDAISETAIKKQAIYKIGDRIMPRGAGNTYGQCLEITEIHAVPAEEPWLREIVYKGRKIDRWGEYTHNKTEKLNWVWGMKQKRMVPFVPKTRKTPK